jgi:outer membrane protein assembly factor BamD (BamD/ComL family)
MSITGIFGNSFSPENTSENSTSRFQQIRNEFQQLAQDLQSGNLTQAQQDYTTLSQNFSNSGRTSTNPIVQAYSQLGQDLQAGNLTQAQQDFTTLTQDLQGGNQANTNPITQAFNQLAQDLQAGNLQGAQQEFTSLQQDLQQVSAQVGGHHGRHHGEENTQSSASSQQNSPITQAFGQLAQSLQSGNLSGAQQAFATIENDLEQTGGLVVAGSSGNSGAAEQANAGSLNVSA